MCAFIRHSRLGQSCWLAMALILSSCSGLIPSSRGGADSGEGGGNGGSSGGASNEPFELTVEAVYSTAGVNWMDYVENNGADLYSGTDTACNGNALINGGVRNGEAGLGFDVCIHGGELRKVEIDELDSCDGLSLSDDLDVFEWICDDS